MSCAEAAFRASITPEAVVLGASGGESLLVDRANLPALDPDSPIVTDSNTVFDLHGFEVPRRPLVLGTGYVEALQAIPKGFRVSTMLIKLPGSSVRIPSEIAPVSRLIMNSVEGFAAANPRFVDERFVYLSLERTFTAAGDRQRNAGEPHSDGNQARGVSPRVPIESYATATDRYPTLWYDQEFDMTEVDSETHRLSDVFRTQIDPTKILQFEPGDLLLTDAYNVHNRVRAGNDGDRTFIRVTSSLREFRRPGNGVNELFANEYAELGWVFDQSR